MSATRSRWWWRRPRGRRAMPPRRWRSTSRPCQRSSRRPTRSRPAPRCCTRRRPTMSCWTGPSATWRRWTRIFAGAAHSVELRLRNSRVVVAPMEPRAALGEFDADSESWILRVGCQGVFGHAQRPARRARRRGPRACADQCRRRQLRHEGLALSRVHLRPSCGEAARPPGEVDRRPQRQLPVRQPRPRPRPQDRAGARRATAPSWRCE